MSTYHLSELAIDALALEVLSARDRDHASSHLTACESCRARMVRARALRDELPSRVMTRTLDALDRQRRSRWWWIALKLATPLAIVAMLIVFMHHRTDAEVIPGDDPRTVDGLTVKGAPTLQVYALRDHSVFAVTEGMTLVAGDEIRFAVIPAGASHVLIGSIDGAGNANIYFPYEGDRSATVAPSTRTELPGSVVLDDAPGPERIFAVFSTSPIAASELRAELRRIVATGVSVRDVHRLALRARTASVMFEKGKR